MHVLNLKYNIKGICTFHLILVSILSILILSVKNKRVGEYLLNVKILLSVTKVISWQSLSLIATNYPYKIAHVKTNHEYTDQINLAESKL